MRPCQGRDREFKSRRDRSDLLEYSRRFFILSDPQTRLFSRQLLLLVILLAVFGIVFDMLEIGSTHPVMGPILGIFDNGGEMVVMSMITVFVANASRQHPEPDTGSAAD